MDRSASPSCLLIKETKMLENSPNLLTDIVLIISMTLTPIIILAWCCGMWTSREEWRLQTKTRQACWQVWLPKEKRDWTYRNFVEEMEESEEYEERCQLQQWKM